MNNRASPDFGDALFDTRDKMESIDFLYYHTMHPAARFWVRFGCIVCLYQLASEGGVRINDPLPVSNGKDITKIKDTLKVYKRISNNIRKLLTKKYFRIY